MGYCLVREEKGRKGEKRGEKGRKGVFFGYFFSVGPFDGLGRGGGGGFGGHFDGCCEGGFFFSWGLLAVMWR